MAALKPAPRYVFVTNFCPHYRVQTFAALARRVEIIFYFYSSGGEKYWLKEHGTRRGDFACEYLSGINIGHTRITPGLVSRLWNGDYDVVIKCINGKYALAVAYLIARLRRKPFVLWTGVWHTLETPSHRLLFPLIRYLYRHSDAIVTYGDHVKRYLTGLGVSDDKIFCAHHAVDNAAYARPVCEKEVRALRSALRLPDGRRIVLYVGRLERIKGLDILLTAFAESGIPDAVLVLAGTGSEQSALEQQAMRLGILPRVRFTDYIPVERIVRYYASAYVAVLPSITTPRGKECWGLVVNEAMNQGVPVIATDAVGAAAGGLVQDGVNGLIVPEGDAKSLAAALRRLLSHPDLRERMSRNARARVLAWDNERMVAGFLQALEYVRATVPSADDRVTRRERPLTT
jgi:glycosyltransferase involved in cell wall biosynthesis